MPNSPGPGTSRWVLHDDRAVRAVSLRGCLTPFHRNVVSAERPLRCRARSKINSPDIPAIQSNPALCSGPTSTTCCSFEMIRASFPTGVGKIGVFALYITKGHQRASELRARTTDQREIRCKRQGRRSGASAEPFGLSTRVPTGTRAIRHPHRTESDLAQHHWSSTGSDHVSGHRQCANLTCSQLSLPVTARPAHERPRGPRPLHRDNTRKE